MKRLARLSTVIFLLMFGLAAGHMGMCHAAVTEADLSGNYLGVSLYPDEIDSFYVTLDGSGGWQEIGSTETGTYVVADNLLTIYDAASSTITDGAYVGPEGQFFTFLGADPYGFEFAMQLGNLSAADLNGERYNYVSVSRELQDDDITWAFDICAGHIAFGDGQLSVYNEYDFSDGVDDDVTPDLNYAVNAGIISFPDDPDRSGIIGPDGSVMGVVYNSADEQEIVFLVKAATLEKEDIYGRYIMMECEYDTIAISNQWEFGTGYVLFDGEGNYTVPGEADETGTYDIDADGRVVLDGETTYGPVSPDGNFIIVPWMEEQSGTVEEIGASFLLKAPNPAVTAVTSTDTNVTSVDGSSTSTTDNALQSEYQNVPDNFKAMTDVVQFTAEVTDYATCEFEFDTSGQFGSVSDKVLLKLKDSSDSLAFEYASQSQTTAGNYVDGTWWITDTSGYLSESDTLDPSETYTIHMAITDNGDYDLDPDAGEIEDPTVLGATPQTSSSGDDGGSGGGGGGGCFIQSMLN